jgi:membrane protein YdbS with pleckstrin-like domain
MEPPTPPEPQPGLPATRPVPPPVVPRQPRAGWPPAPQQPQPPQQPAPRPRFSWRRLTRSPRGAAGLAIVVAALLLWPFAGWSWIPWLAGLGVVVLLRLLRLDKLLRDWDLHIAGLVVIAGLMLSSGPWSWALAASIGVLLAGLAQLPWWKLAAVGAVMCLVSGVGFGISQYQAEQKAVEQQKQASAENFTLVGERTPQRVLPALLEGIGQGDVPAVCGILDDAAEQAFVQASRAPDCRAAVAAFKAAAGPAPKFEDLPATTTPVGTSWLTDGCRTVWAQAPLGGPALGRLDIRQSAPPGRTYFIAAFQPC